MDFLAGQPHRRSLRFGNKTVLMVHSTPWEPRGEYVYPHSARLARFAEAEADFVLYGHTHAQVVRQVGRVLVINPGSAGDARDNSNDRQLSCAVLDTATHDVQMIDYPGPAFRRPLTMALRIPFGLDRLPQDAATGRSSAARGDAGR